LDSALSDGQRIKKAALVSQAAFVFSVPRELQPPGGLQSLPSRVFSTGLIPKESETVAAGYIQIP